MSVEGGIAPAAPPEDVADIKAVTDAQLIVSGTSPNTAGTTNTSTRIELDSNASAVDGAYDPAQIFVTGGTGAGQARQIWQYVGATKLAYVNRDWKVTPDDTSTYSVFNFSGNTHVNEGVAQAGGAATITLNALASAQNNLYLGQMVFLVAGTGADQARMVIGYNGTTKVATVDANWTVQPDSTSVYAMLPYPGFVHGVAGVDSTDNVLSRDVTGNKSDAASAAATASSIALLREVLATASLQPVTETTGTFSYDETSAAEQTAFTLTIAARAVLGSVWLDMSNVTQDTDIAVYHQIDGSNYRQFQENSWLSTDDAGVWIDGFTAYRNVRVTLQCAGGGGGSVNVPYVVV